MSFQLLSRECGGINKEVQSFGKSPRLLADKHFQLEFEQLLETGRMQLSPGSFLSLTKECTAG
jgi:hypothetical protein